MKSSKPALLVAAAAALLSPVAFAQDGAAPSMASAFTALDADNDGGINRNEAQASPAVSQSFAKADADSNGSITREEFGSAFTMNAPPPPSAELPDESAPPPQ